MDFIKQAYSTFERHYSAKLRTDTWKGRYHTMQAALNLLLQRGGKTIVETGCQRQAWDWGAGCSTVVLAQVAKEQGLNFYSIDINPDNIKKAQELTSLPSDHLMIGNSVDILKNWISGPIDLLYLDSFDYPYGEMLEHFGGKTDIDTAMEILEHLHPMRIKELFGGVIAACQQHCLQETIVAMPFLHQKSVILIDDANLPGGGKAELAREWLLANGWHIVLDLYQSLYIHS